MIDNDIILRVAALALVLYNASDDEVENLGTKLEAEMRGMDDPSRILVMLAKSLLSGRPYLLVSDNRCTVARVRSLAAHMGATVTEQDAPPGQHALQVEPRARS